MWCRCWYDPASRQTRRASLGTSDLREAERALAEWIAREVPTVRGEPADVGLARAFLRYEEGHIRRKLAKAGAAAQRRSLGMILAHAPDGATVAGLTIRRQEAMAEAMAAAGYGPWTVKRAFGAAKAAVTWAFEREELSRPIPFISLPDGENRKRVLTVAELARLWDADMPEHVRVFLALLIGTAARPEALLDLTRFQCDLGDSLIRLNPPGRKQTKKRRPVLPMADWLRPWIEAAPGPVVAFRGRRVHKIAGAFQTMRDGAGFGPDVTAYTVRHTVATELKRRGVSMEDVSMVLGHKMPNATTERYVHVGAGFLADAKRALEDLANDIGRLAGRPMVPTNLCVEVNQRASSVLVPLLGSVSARPKSLVPRGAAVETGFQPSLAMVRRVSPAASPSGARAAGCFGDEAVRGKLAFKHQQWE